MLVHTDNVFADIFNRVYDHRFDVTLQVKTLVGGIPFDERKAEGWIKKNAGLLPAEDQARLIKETLEATGTITAETDPKEAQKLIDDAVSKVVDTRYLNGFKRSENGELYIEGRQVKAMIKEAANIRWPMARWGASRKGTRSYFAEHVFVQEDRLYLGTKEPTGVEQRFVHTWRGSSIQYEEYLRDQEVVFTICADEDLSKAAEAGSNGPKGNERQVYGELFVTGSQNGLGASRSQGYGRFTVVRFDKQK